MKKLLLSCLTALCLVGCTSAPTPTNKPEEPVNEPEQPTNEPSTTPDTEPEQEAVKKTVCALNQEGVSVETSFEHDGVKVLKQVNTNTIVLSKAGLNKEQIEEAAANANETYSAIAGVTYSYEFKDDDTFVETTTIDFTAASIADLQSAGIVEAGEADYIGIKETIELNNQNGIECKDAE